MNFSSPQKKLASNSKSKSESSSSTSKSSSHETQFTHDMSSNQTQDNMLDLQQTLGNQEIQRMVKSGLLQPKLKISQPNDPCERDADMVADQIMRMSDSYGKETPIQDNSENGIQRKCSSCEMNEKKKENKELKISRKHVSSNSSLETSDEISNQINHVSGGRPLDNTTKSFMESRFNRDFSSVKIHDDSKAKDLASSVNARAFTKGNDIFFGRNESTSNKSLMAHELTHVAQQNQNSFQFDMKPIAFNKLSTTQRFSGVLRQTVPHITSMIHLLYPVKKSLDLEGEVEYLQMLMFSWNWIVLDLSRPEKRV